MPHTSFGHFNVFDSRITDESFIEKKMSGINNFNPGSYDGFIHNPLVAQLLFFLYFDILTLFEICAS